MTDERDGRETDRGTTTGEGFAVLGVAIRREPWIFTLSTIGSLLFGVMTVADAWVLGWATDHVVVPAFRDGEIGAGLLWAVLGLFMAVAVLRAVGIVARRLGAGVGDGGPAPAGPRIETTPVPAGERKGRPCLT